MAIAALPHPSLAGHYCLWALAAGPGFQDPKKVGSPEDRARVLKGCGARQVGDMSLSAPSGPPSLHCGQPGGGARAGLPHSLHQGWSAEPGLNLGGALGRGGSVLRDYSSPLGAGATGGAPCPPWCARARPGAGKAGVGEGVGGEGVSRPPGRGRNEEVGRLGFPGSEAEWGQGVCDADTGEQSLCQCYSGGWQRMGCAASHPALHGSLRSSQSGVQVCLRGISFPRGGVQGRGR